MFPSGPSGVGVNELRRKLMEIDPRTFQGATPRQYSLAVTTHPVTSVRSPSATPHAECFFRLQTQRGHRRCTRNPGRSITSSAGISLRTWCMTTGDSTRTCLWGYPGHKIKDWYPAVCVLRFVEYGEFRGHLYGTSVDAVKDVLAAGKICVIDIDPYVSVKHLLL